MRETEKDSLNGQGKEHVRDKEGNEAERSIVQLTLQHGAPHGTESRRDTLAKDKGIGICVRDSESDRLTNLRFADDVLLFSTSLKQLRKMMCDLKQSAERVGLKIHPDKRNILSKQSSNKSKEVDITNSKVEILPACESAKCQGQTITFQQQETAEIKNRIRAAWASFYKYK